MTSKEAQKRSRQELGWNGTGSTNPREGSPRKDWHKRSRMWTTQNGILMIKGGCERQRVSYRNQMPTGKEEKENKEGRWSGAFLATLALRRDPPRFEKINKS